VASVSRGTALAALGAAAAVLLQPVLATSAFASPATPTSLSPNDGALHKDAVLSWAAVPGASSYQVQMSATGDFDNNEVALPNGGTSVTNSFELPILLPHSTYEWRVRAVNGSGASAWSAPVDLTRAWSSAPVAAASPAPSDLRFSWSPIEDASMYEVQLSNTAFMTDPSPVQTASSSNDPNYSTTCLTLHTTFTPYTSETSGDNNIPACEIDYSKLGSPFFWRVRGIDSTSSSVPATSATPQIGCEGIWHEPNDPAGSSSAAVPADDTNGECSRWSAVQSVSGPTPVTPSGDFRTFGGPTPLCVSGSCGASSTGNVFDAGTFKHAPTFTWGNVPDGGVGNVASYYRVTLALDESFTNVQRYYRSLYHSLTPRDELVAGRDYYLAVQGCSADGCGNISYLKFHMAHNAVTGMTQSRVLNGEQLGWNDYLANGGGNDLEAKEYKVEVAKAGDTSFSSPVLTDTVDRQGETAGKARHFVQVADGSYIWRVQAIDGSSDALPWSAASAFSIDTTPPVFTLASTSTLPIKGGQIHFSATEASGVVNNVSATTLHPVSLTTGAAVPGSLQNTGFLTWTFVPSGALTVGDRYGVFASPSITDAAGNAATATGASARVSTTADDKSGAWHFSSGWTRHSSSNAIGRTFMSAASGHSATVQAVTSKISVYGCKGPKFAKLRIQVDGQTKTTANEHQSFSKCGVLLWSGTVPSGLHTVRVATTGGTGTVDAVKVS